MNRLIQPGSSIYYSLRFLAPEPCHAISCLFSFSQEIEKAVKQSQNPAVTQRKLQWWQQELTASSPSHPLIQALQPIVKNYAVSVQLLQEVIAGIARQLSNCCYKDFKDYSEQHYRAISSFPLWVALIMTPKDQPKPLLFVHDLGIFLQTVEVIHELRADLQQGYIFLPEHAMQQFQLSEQELLALTSSPSLALLLADLAHQARQYYQQALARLDSSQRYTQSASLILAELYDQLLTEIAQDNFNVLKRQVFLSPLRKLWLAWRLAKRLRK